MALRLQPIFTDLKKLASSSSSSDEIKAMWTIITKAKDSIDYGYRLENISWRLWYSSTHPRSTTTTTVTATPRTSNLMNTNPVLNNNNNNYNQNSDKNVSLMNDTRPSYYASKSNFDSVKIKTTVISCFSNILEEIQEASRVTSLNNSHTIPGLKSQIGSPTRKLQQNPAVSPAAKTPTKQQTSSKQQHPSAKGPEIIKKTAVIASEVKGPAAADPKIQVVQQHQYFDQINDKIGLVTRGFVPVKISKVNHASPFVEEDNVGPETTNTRSNGATLKQQQFGGKDQHLNNNSLHHHHHHHQSGISQKMAFKNLDQYFALEPVKGSLTDLKEVEEGGRVSLCSREEPVTIPNTVSKPPRKIDNEATFFVPSSESPLGSEINISPEKNMSDIVPKNIMLTSVQTSVNLSPSPRHKQSLLSSMIRSSVGNSSPNNHTSTSEGSSQKSLSPGQNVQNSNCSLRTDLLQDALPVTDCAASHNPIIGHRRYSSASVQNNMNRMGSAGNGSTSNELGNHGSVVSMEDDKALFEIW